MTSDGTDYCFDCGAQINAADRIDLLEVQLHLADQCISEGDARIDALEAALREIAATNRLPGCDIARQALGASS